MLIISLKKLTAMNNRPQMPRASTKPDEGIKQAHIGNNAAALEAQAQSNFRKTFSLVDVKTFFQVRFFEHMCQV